MELNIKRVGTKTERQCVKYNSSEASDRWLGGVDNVKPKHTHTHTHTHRLLERAGAQRVRVAVVCISVSVCVCMCMYESVRVCECA